MAVVHDFTCPPGFEPEEVNPDDQAQVTADLEDENIELWMIKAPLNFDISLLSGHELKEHFNIPLEKKSDIEFVAKATENHPMCKTLQTVFPHKTKNKLKIGPSFKGYVDIVQSVKIPRCDNPALPQEKPYQIPSNLKQRYIPYGSHSPPRICITQIVKKKSKKRKRSSESLSFSMPDLHASQVRQVDPEEPPLKKKKKKHKEKKDLDESLMSVDMMDDSCPILPPQTPEAVLELNGSYLPNSVGEEELCSPQRQTSEKKKKRKKSRDSLDEKLLKNVQEETPKLKESHAPNYIGEEEMMSVSEKKKKKKMKKSRDEIDGSLLENVQEPLLNGSSLQNSIVDEIMNEHISPAIESKKKKPKRKSRDLNQSTSVNNEEPLLNGSSLQNSIVDVIMNEPVSPAIESKKKKHKRKSRDLNLSTSVNNEENSLSLHSNKSILFNEQDVPENHKTQNGLAIPESSYLDDHDESLTMSGKKKKRKHKGEKEKEEEKTIDDNNKMAINSWDDGASQKANIESSSKKKHKGEKEKKEEKKIEDDDNNKMAINSWDDGTSPKANMVSSSKKKHKGEKGKKIEDDDDNNKMAINSWDDGTSPKANMESSSKKEKKTQR